LGVIYFMRSQETGLIKIGTSLRLRARIANLTHQSRETLSVIGVADGAIVEERELHWRFHDDHVKGEWFEPSLALLEYIEFHSRPWDGIDELPPPRWAKVDVDVMQDARIVVAYSGEKLADYLSRLLRPLVARDLEREQTKAIRSKKTE
jgi:hypothetical protein